MTDQSENIFGNLEELEVKLSRTKSWGGIETENSYGPADTSDADYAEKLGDPGTFPFTRGAYPKMYRSRMWTLRNIVGYGAPEDTRDGLEKVLASGGTGINIVVDPLTTQSIDPDHPSFGPEVGLEGCSLPTANDIDRLLDGVDLSKIDTAWHWAAMAYPMVAAVHVKRGQPLETLQGSSMPDMLQETLSGWGERLVPTVLGHKTTVDEIEYSVQNSPRWALGMPQAYDLRERGLTPAGEIALGMAFINKTLEDLVERGLHVDQIAPSLAWVSTSDIDFFEEVAKFRALRRFWATTMKDRFGAQDVRSMRLRVACHTSGKSLVYKQPLNNLTRTAIEGFAALCGGVQSLEVCTFDEPVGVPTHEARDLAIRQQQILANEVGAARVADPLGGSWYVEALTDAVETEAKAMLDQIEKIGLLKAISDGTIEQMMDDHNLKIQRELDDGERIVVGGNRFMPEEEPAPQRFTFDRTNTENHIRRFIALKGSRDQDRWRDALRTVHSVAKSGGNPIGPMIDAFVADASVGEVWGSIRVAHGLSYDPYDTLEAPLDYAD
ncbi:methylmalonyl-CoA mutase family protein [Aurantiacibacter rhizosphaerae]|uniref:Methylmalonyl-CoA mutase n=1 Tax=Aurantiacibacter rhizosphaerae TaxID=2691582 RepID=A0A844XIA2_9SPHN|nr:methylmalonyl-CoA mutase family protein [Aurantiacibacter rhizosphaerae]MWV29295.1 methylmalonyl-CoA mutase [Aurantiacibacter rhizosphaerae]